MVNGLGSYWNYDLGQRLPSDDDEETLLALALSLSDSLHQAEDPQTAEAIRLSLAAQPPSAHLAPAGSIPLPGLAIMPPLPAQPYRAPAPKIAPAPAKLRIDPTLFKTTLASSTVSHEPLTLAVTNAKINPKLRITSHEIATNDVGNKFLILGFASGIQRTMAIEELRSSYGMFKKDGPNRVGEKLLELTVEQSVEFQNLF